MSITESMGAEQSNRSESSVSEILSTDSFRMGAGFFSRTLIGRYGLKWMIIPGVILVASAVAGLVLDWRWFMVGIMFLLIIVPGITAMVYYSAALRPECYVNLPEHSLMLADGGIEVALGERKVFFPLSGYEPRSIRADGTILSIGSSGNKWKGFLWIPVSAFPSEEEYVAFIRGCRGEWK